MVADERTGQPGGLGDGMQFYAEPFAERAHRSGAVPGRRRTLIPGNTRPMSNMCLVFAGRSMTLPFSVRYSG